LATIFFSYSHADEELRDQLDVHLAALKRQEIIETWHDRRITAGTDIGSSIDEQLERAAIILCLVSPDFIASDYCYSREMQRALERHEKGEARVIPVILRHCEWEQTPLRNLRGTPRDNRPVVSWADRDEAFNWVARDIRNAVAEMGFHFPSLAKLDQARHPASAPAPEPVRPRSSNLHIKREFSDLDRDTFLRESFEFIAEFIASSMHELKKRHPTVDGSIQRLDAKRLTAVLYKNGTKQSAMTVFLGSMFGNGISFNNADAGDSSTANGSFSLQVGTDELRFNADLFNFGGRAQPKGLEPIHVAEALWERLMTPLQDDRTGL
jgi:hypothetical protein